MYVTWEPPDPDLGLSCSSQRGEARWLAADDERSEEEQIQQEKEL